MKNPDTLSCNDIIDIIAPSGKVHDTIPISQLENSLEHWGYHCRFGKHIFGKHAFLSNTLENRFEDIKNALFSSHSKAIWLYRGGNGCAELLPLLDKLTPPKNPKIILGFSDITSLHLFFNQQWDWVTFHGPVLRNALLTEIPKIFEHQPNNKNFIDQNSINSLKKLFQYGIKPDQIIDLQLKPFNASAEKFSKISGKLAGGNLTVICHSLGTPYQIKPLNKILLLEDVNEPAYKIRRMLTQLNQANIFDRVKALIWGNFMGNHVNEKLKNDIENELMEFSNLKSFPIFKTEFIGHGKQNYVVPLNLPIVLPVNPVTLPS